MRSRMHPLSPISHCRPLMTKLSGADLIGCLTPVCVRLAQKRLLITVVFVHESNTARLGAPETCARVCVFLHAKLHAGQNSPISRRRGKASRLAYSRAVRKASEWQHFRALSFALPSSSSCRFRCPMTSTQRVDRRRQPTPWALARRSFRAHPHSLGSCFPPLCFV